MATLMTLLCDSPRVEACDTNYMHLRLEGDIFPEDEEFFMGGDGIMTFLDVILTGQYATKLITPLDCAFTAIDSAPPETLGDGAITVCDFVNAACLSLLYRQPTAGIGGPDAPVNVTPAAGVGPRKLSVVASNLLWGEEAVVSVVLDGAGDEMGVGFTLEFDPAALELRSREWLGIPYWQSSGGDFYHIDNTTEVTNGRVAGMIAMAYYNLPPGRTEIARFHFGVTNWSCTNLAFNLTDALARREVASSNAYPLATSFQNASYLVTNAVFKLAQPETTGLGSKLVISSKLNTRFDLEISSNLIHWTRLATLTNTVGRTPYTDTNTAGISRRFYRAVETP